MARKNFCTTLEEEILRALKLQSVKEDKRVNDIIEELVRKYLLNENDQQKVSQ